MKKTLALFLAVMSVVTLPLFSSCKKTGENDTTASQTPAPSIDDKYNIPDDLPEVQIDRTFRIMGEGGNGWNAGGVIMPEADSADPVTNANYKRYEDIKNRFGVEVETFLNDSVYNALSGSIKAGDTEAFDLVFMSTANSSKAAIDGYTLNLKNVPYIDLEKPYYDQNYIHDMSIGENVYSAVTDVLTIDTHCMWIMMYNRNLIDSYDLEDPYELVKNNEWTLDKLASMLEIATAENGDGTWDEKDKYGLGAHLGSARNFFYASNLKICRKDENNIPYIAIENNQNVITVMEKTQKILHGGNTMLGGGIIDNFRNGNTLFLAEIAGYLGAFREMEDDYGVVPYPKLDSNQLNFYTSNDPCIMVMSVPDFLRKDDDPELENIGILTEALCSASYRYLRPAYYEKVLGGKNTRHEEDFEMLNLCKDSRVYDFGLFNNLGKISTLFVELIATPTATYSSTVARNIRKAQTTLDSLIESYEKDD